MTSAVRVGAIFAILVSSLAHASQQSDLSAMENMVAKQFNGLRKQAGLSQLKVRRDLRVRMEACSVQVKGPDPLVDIAQQGRKFWYLTADPEKPHEELARLAKEKTGDDHVAVGVWFATTQQYPSGMYWVVVYPERSAVHEGFWSHFYLTDDFEYQTSFGKHWEKELPRQCRSIQ